MNPHRVVSLLAAIVLVSFPILAASPAPATNPGARDQPNFIIVLTDDLDAKSVEFMPRLKALLTSRGTTFSNYFVTDSICCPSRASLLRGQYPHNHQVLSNFQPGGGFQKFYTLEEEQSTIAAWLKAAGYRTVLLGKYLNGYPGSEKTSYVPPGWDEWYGLMYHHAAYYNYQLNENGRVVSYGHGPADYETDVLAAKTVDFIARNDANGKRPFFIYLAPSAPHLPATPAPRHAKEFPHATAPRTPSFNEGDLSDKPAWLRGAPPLKRFAEIDSMYRSRLQSMLAVDEMIGKIVDALQANGTLEQTYIFFTSDNGFHLGEHRLDKGKGTPYEEDIRVPLIVRGPGVPAGRTLPHFVLNIDLAPTLADLAGAAPARFVDGRSLRPLLAGAPPSAGAWRNDFVVEYWSPSMRKAPAYEALRTSGYLYVEYVSGERELYDLRADPYELKNLAGSAAPGLVSELSKRLRFLEHCAGESCRRPQ